MIKRLVVKRNNGWAVQAPGKKASVILPTQKEAEKRAKEIVKNAGGGEVVIQGKDGKFRAADTVSPGNDPKDIKG